MPDATTIAFHADLQISLLGLFRHKLQFKTRTVSVGANDCETVAVHVFATDREGNQGGLVFGHEILAERRCLPGLTHLELAEAGLAQQLLRGLDDVKCCRTSVKKVDEFGAVQ